jgi:hypothetical protein
VKNPRKKKIDTITILIENEKYSFKHNSTIPFKMAKIKFGISFILK